MEDRADFYEQKQKRDDKWKAMKERERKQREEEARKAEPLAGTPPETDAKGKGGKGGPKAAKSQGAKKNEKA